MDNLNNFNIEDLTNRLTSEDIKIISKCEYDLAREEYTHTKTLNNINIPKYNKNIDYSYMYLGIKDSNSNNNLIGYISINDNGNILDSNRIFDCGYVNTLYILPEYRHFGLGKMLINKTKEYIKTNYNQKYIILGANDYNTAALSFYNRNGFKIIYSQYNLAVKNINIKSTSKVNYKLINNLNSQISSYVKSQIKKEHTNIINNANILNSNKLNGYVNYLINNSNILELYPDLNNKLKQYVFFVYNNNTIYVQSLINISNISDVLICLHDWSLKNNFNLKYISYQTYSDHYKSNILHNKFKRTGVYLLCRI